MERVCLREAVLLDPEAGRRAPGGLLLRDGRIEARLAPGERGPDDARAGRSLAGAALAPGFLDLHFHGSLLFHDAAGFDASLAASSRSARASWDDRLPGDDRRLGAGEPWRRASRRSPSS